MSYTLTEMYLLQRLQDRKVSYNAMAEILGLLQHENQQWELMSFLNTSFDATEAQILKQAKKIAAK